MKPNKVSLFLFAWLCSLTVTVSAQKVPEKPFQKWSKDEATKILTESPWVQTYQSAKGIAEASRDQIRREQADQRIYRASEAGASARTMAPVPVTIRLHSAVPIRQALVRLRQIQAGYDKMDDKQRADFDKANEALLGCTICRKFYVVTMTRFVDSTKQSVDEGVFQRMNLEQLKGNIWLANDKGERRELVQFIPPKDDRDMTVFFFARLDEKGTPLLTPENKKFEFVFNNTFFNSSNPYAAWLPRHFEFSVSKLMHGSEIEF